jgi:hypothetical protein
MTDTKEIVKKPVKPETRIVRLVSGEQLIASISALPTEDFVKLYSPYKIDIYNMEPEPSSLWSEERMALKPWCFQTTDSVIIVKKHNILALAHPTKSIVEYYTNIKTGKFPPTITPLLKQDNKENEPIQQIKPRLPVEEFNRLLEAIDNDEEYNELFNYIRGKKTIH